MWLHQIALSDPTQQYKFPSALTKDKLFPAGHNISIQHQVKIGDSLHTKYISIWHMQISNIWISSI